MQDNFRELLTKGIKWDMRLIPRRFNLYRTNLGTTRHQKVYLIIVSSILRPFALKYSFLYFLYKSYWLFDTYAVQRYEWYWKYANLFPWNIRKYANLYWKILWKYANLDVWDTSLYNKKMGFGLTTHPINPHIYEKLYAI